MLVHRKCTISTNKTSCTTLQLLAVVCYMTYEHRMCLYFAPNLHISFMRPLCLIPTFERFVPADSSTPTTVWTGRRHSFEIDVFREPNSIVRPVVHLQRSLNQDLSSHFGLPPLTDRLIDLIKYNTRNSLCSFAEYHPSRTLTVYSNRHDHGNNYVSVADV